ncbi:hypothetical protein GGP85_003199 [Salinibacter ruber]|nr:hypothetical protein [Salinibacter ruber]MCS3827729.1 hypothetical protein [Salinibacter ruber]MCS4146232.1 hypothetical protein [Salinibacter ruber]
MPFRVGLCDKNTTGSLRVNCQARYLTEFLLWESYCGNRRHAPLIRKLGEPSAVDEIRALR